MACKGCGGHHHRRWWSRRKKEHSHGDDKMNVGCEYRVMHYDTVNDTVLNIVIHCESGNVIGFIETDKNEETIQQACRRITDDYDIQKVSEAA